MLEDAPTGLIVLKPDNSLERIVKPKCGAPFVGAALAAKFMRYRKIIAAKAAPSEKYWTNGLSGFKPSSLQAQNCVIRACAGMTG